MKLYYIWKILAYTVVNVVLPETTEHLKRKFIVKQSFLHHECYSTILFTVHLTFLNYASSSKYYELHISISLSLEV